jgi:glycerol uptake facilitator-like aquaporin
VSDPALARRLLAEFTGTGLLVTVVVGSGIMAVRLSPGDAGLGRAPEPGGVSS